MSKINRKFKELGTNVVFYEPIDFIHPESIVLKNNIVISAFTCFAGGLGLYVGNYIHISAYSCITGGGYCILEDFVGLSAGCRIITGSEDISGDGLTNPTILNDFSSF